MKQDVFLDFMDKVSVSGWELLSVLNISTASVCLEQIWHYIKNLEWYKAWLTLAFNQENADESIIGCNHLLTAAVVLATISLCVKNTRVKVKVTVDRRCRGRDNTKCNNRQSYRATKIHRKYFFLFALWCCNTRINLLSFRKPKSKGSVNCNYDIFESKYILSYEWSNQSSIRGTRWVVSGLFHKAGKGGQQPAFHRTALLPLQ